MSEQVRFKIEGCKVNPDLASICITFVKDENGEYVRYEDYARLKAEVEHLQNCLGDAHAINAKEELKTWERIENLKAEVERLTDTLNKLVKTPPEATGGVRVKVDFWTQCGSRLPSSYETFWENAAKEGNGHD